jgi:two-component system, OmpR family, sensor histidine kinase KdpD
VELFINKVSKPRQFLISILLICIVSGFCYVLQQYINYKVVAFVLLVTVSLLAVTLDIFPVLTAAVLSALIWDFFFITPYYTFQVKSTEDVILLLMYFIIASVNAVLTYKIRQIEKLARQKEEKANTVKLYNTLLNSLSHELRTPISTIIAATDNLQSNTARLSAYDKNELIGEISTASFRLNQQVENLLNMSRLESGFIQPKRDWCDISEVVYDAVKRIEENHISQEIHISIKPGIPLFKLDKGMMEQILYNLLNNAAIYTEPGCSINVSATSYADVLEIIVEDNGKGFPPDEIKNVFEKFYRLKDSGTGGTGLGLSIVKGFVEAQGGTVTLENIDKGGARFSISIKAETTHLKLKSEA